MALRDHRSSLRASLRAEYGIDLRAVLNDPDSNLLDLADLVVWLPPGCAFWRDAGGPAAITAEQRDIRRVRFAITQLEYAFRGSKGARPKPDPEPPYASERTAKADAMAEKAAAHKARQRGR